MKNAEHLHRALDQLSPDALALIAAYLQPAAHYRPPTQRAREAVGQAEDFMEAIVTALGVDRCNRLWDEIGC